MDNFDRLLIFLAFVSITFSNIAHNKCIKIERERIDNLTKIVMELKGK